jgi:hypothetical protein
MRWDRWTMSTLAGLAIVVAAAAAAGWPASLAAYMVAVYLGLVAIAAALFVDEDRDAALLALFGLAVILCGGLVAL